MKLPVWKPSGDAQPKPGGRAGLLAKKLLRKRVSIPVLACVLAVALALRLAGGGPLASAAGLTYTTAPKVLCSIYDLSYLTMTLSVDELDVSDIAAGQVVSITADAAEGKTYAGVVTKVSVAGTVSGGTTTYPVTVRIDKTDGLLPGMNVDAAITLQSAADVLAVPTGALNRGNTVFVTADSPSASKGTVVENGQERYYSVPVETGASDSSYIEIISGLQEGDTVAYIPATSTGGFDMMMPGGMGGVSFGDGAMPGGGMPSGGPGGGRGGF